MNLIKTYIYIPIRTKFFSYKFNKLEEEITILIQDSSSYFRKINLKLILDNVKFLYIQKPSRTFKSTIIWNEYSKKARGIQIDAENPNIIINLDKLKRLPLWRVGFDFNLIKDDLFFWNFIYSQMKNKIDYDINQLDYIEAYLYKRNKKNNSIPIPTTLPENSLILHSLFVDILNENKQCARHSNLFEHFIEKTDIRYSNPGIKRNKGSRIRIISAFGTNVFKKSISSLYNKDEIIILSTVTLAKFVIEKEYQSLTEKFSSIDITFDINFFDKSDSVDQLSYKIYSFLFQSINDHKNNNASIEPLQLIPLPIKDLIRCYTLCYAYKCNEVLRNNEFNYGQRASQLAIIKREINRRHAKKRFSKQE